MKIAQVAPLAESVPPKKYGGTERIVAYLTEALIEMGHDVTLFATGDSISNAKLISPCKSALRGDESIKDPYAYYVMLLELVRRQKDEFDIIHYHIDYFHYALSSEIKKPSITTLHGRLDLPDLQPLYDLFTNVPLISISNNQRKPLPQAKWIDTVYHGLPKDLFRFKSGEGNYLAFLGRISPEKRADRAIEIAKKSGMKLKIAAKVDSADRKYFEEHIKHLMDDPLIEFMGEIGENEKKDFLGNAAALLLPIDWPEPFGLVMIESFACGTPVIAFNCGSVPEIIQNGVNGFIVDSVSEAVEAVKKLPLIDRKKCRETFENRFTAKIMAENYVRCYKKLTDEEFSDNDNYLKKAI